jgi:hypothetical protein
LGLLTLARLRSHQGKNSDLQHVACRVLEEAKDASSDYLGQTAAALHAVPVAWLEITPLDALMEVTIMRRSRGEKAIAKAAIASLRFEP